MENLHINFKMSNPNNCSFKKEEWFNTSNYVYYLKQQREKENTKKQSSLRYLGFLKITNYSFFFPLMLCKKIQKSKYVKYVLCKLSFKNHAHTKKKNKYIGFKFTKINFQIQTIKTQTQKENKQTSKSRTIYQLEAT